MTQNASDVEIANQGFAAFRQDLNDVLEDITTLHSGDTAPTTTYANQWWYETDTDKLYIRNEDNDAWIEILTLDQANDHLATLGASITLDGTGNVSIDSGDFTVDTNTLHVDSTNNRVGIGTSSPNGKLHVTDSTDIAMSNDADGQIVIEGNGYSGAIALNATGMQIYQNSNARNIIFGNNETEQMRIDSSGNLRQGSSLSQADPRNYTGNNQQAVQFNYASASQHEMASTYGLFYNLTASGTANSSVISFRRRGTSCGSISVTGTTTAYNTSSDYRLKENVETLSGAITRVKTLQPKRFSWVSDSLAAANVDGFIAHEAQSVVPEAVTGTQDETETLTNVVLSADGKVLHENVMQADWTANKGDGDDDAYASDTTWAASHIVPVYQGIDQAKLVPLLTAALQEAITKIEALETQNADFETRIAALESV